MALLATQKKDNDFRGLSPEAFVVKSDLPWCSLGGPSELVTDLRKIKDEFSASGCRVLFTSPFLQGRAEDQSARAMALGVKGSVVGEQSESHTLNL